MKGAKKPRTPALPVLPSYYISFLSPAQGGDREKIASFSPLPKGGGWDTIEKKAQGGAYRHEQSFSVRDHGRGQNRPQILRSGESHRRGPGGGGFQPFPGAGRGLRRAEGIPAAYGSYEEMLRAGGLDCVYIAATMEAHYALAMLCLDYRVPFLCEKAAFLTRAQAEEVLGRCRELGVFGMEAMWSRFLPANQAAREKLLSGAFGEPRMVSFSLGFRAPQDNGNRYFSPALGGGVSYDLTVYTYELLTFFLPQKPEGFAVQTLWGGGGVDVACNILVRYPRCLARLQSSFLTQPEEDWVIDTDRGRLSMPHANGSAGWRFTPVEGEPVEYRDTQTKNGFVYEIQEVIRCVRGGWWKAPRRRTP